MFTSTWHCHLHLGSYKKHQVLLPVMVFFGDSLDYCVLLWWPCYWYAVITLFLCHYFLVWCVGTYDASSDSVATTSKNSDFLYSHTMIEIHGILYLSHIIFILWCCRWLAVQVILQWFTTTVKLVKPFSHIRLAHGFFNVHSVKHLHHFCHQYSQSLSKYDVNPLLELVHFPTSKPCTLYFHLGPILPVSLMKIEQFHCVCNAHMHKQAPTYLLQYHHCIHFCPRTSKQVAYLKEVNLFNTTPQRCIDPFLCIGFSRRTLLHEVQ